MYNVSLSLYIYIYIERERDIHVYGKTIGPKGEVDWR